MTRTKWIILVACVLSMGAGVEVGMLRARTQSPPAGSKASMLIEELQLTPQQQQEMEKIWKELVSTRGREFAEQMRKLQEQREAAIAGLLDEGQTQKYQEINLAFMEKAKDLWKRAEQEFNAAAEKTRLLLNETQRERYDVMMNQFRAEHANRDWMGMGMSGRGRPATMPDSNVNQ
jgi:hypothetical protein